MSVLSVFQLFIFRIGNFATQNPLFRYAKSRNNNRKYKYTLNMGRTDVSPPETAKRTRVINIYYSRREFRLSFFPRFRVAKFTKGSHSMKYLYLEIKI